MIGSGAWPRRRRPGRKRALTSLYWFQSLSRKFGPHEGHVAERPQALVGEAVIVAVLLLVAQPDAAQDVARMFRRHADAVEPVDGFPVGGAAAVGDPGAAAGAHDRLDRRNQSARRRLHRRFRRPRDCGCTARDWRRRSLRRPAASASAPGEAWPATSRLRARQPKAR